MATSSSRTTQVDAELLNDFKSGRISQEELLARISEVSRGGRRPLPPITFSVGKNGVIEIHNLLAPKNGKERVSYFYKGQLDRLMEALNSEEYQDFLEENESKFSS